MASKSGLERRIRLSSPTRRLRFVLARSALERWSSAGRPLRVLDAGCSEALFSEVIGRRHPRWSIVAIDADPAPLVIAADSLTKADVQNVQLVQGDLTGELGDRDYDAVVALSCLTEISDDDAALTAMAKALRPGGLFLALVPVTGWRNVLPFGRNHLWPGDVRRGYSAEELREKLGRSGLVDIRVTPVGRSFAKAGTEIADRVQWRRLGVRLVWFPLAVAISAADRLGLTWGPPTALFVQASAGSVLPPE